MAVVDNFAVYLNVLFAVSGLVAIAIAYDYLNRMGIQRGEYYSLLMFSVSGMMLMASAADLIMFFLALELLSIPLYILSGFAVPRSESEESALKYFILGAFSSGFVLYGTALIYGGTQFTALSDIISAIKIGQADTGLVTIGAGLLLVGFSFKVAVVPFHMWTPDVYQGAPSPVTAFMSIGAKAAGFAALIRVFTIAFPTLSPVMAPLFAVLSALTMIVGNIAAVSQSNIKRMLAYSSIAHAGYILMALVPYGNVKTAANSTASAILYLVVYGMTSLGAWAVISAVEKADGQGLGNSGLQRAGQAPSLAGGCHGCVHAFVYRGSTLDRLLGKILPVPHCDRRWLYRSGCHRFTHIHCVCLVLPACSCHDVYARWRSFLQPRFLGEPGCNYHGSPRDPGRIDPHRVVQPGFAGDCQRDCLTQLFG